MFWPLDEELVVDASWLFRNVRTLIVEEETEELVDYAIHSFLNSYSKRCNGKCKARL